MKLMRFLAYFGRVMLPPEEREKTEVKFALNDKPLDIQSIGFDSGKNAWVIRLKPGESADASRPSPRNPPTLAGSRRRAVQAARLVHPVRT